MVSTERAGFTFTLEGESVAIEGNGEQFGGTIYEGQSLDSFAREWVGNWWRYLDDLACVHSETTQVHSEYMDGLYDGQVW